MPIKIPQSKPSIQIEPGTYLARCYSMIHIGTNSFTYQGENKSSNQVRISFELPTEKFSFKEGEDPKPFVVSKYYTLSLHEKSKLRPMLEGWRGKKFTDDEIKDFEISNLVGVPAFISIIHNDKGYAEIASVSRPPKGTECPPQINPSVVLSYDSWSEDIFKSLPEFIQNSMKSSLEYKQTFGTIEEKVENTQSTDIHGSDIPF